MAPEQARGEIDRGRRAGRRLRAGLDPLRDPHRPAGVHWPIRRRDPAQGGAGRPGRRPRPARRLRGRRRADRAGQGLPGAEPEDRPREAGAVAERMTAYLAGVQERLQAAERERAVAVARADRGAASGARCSSAWRPRCWRSRRWAGSGATYYLQQRSAPSGGRGQGRRRGVDALATWPGAARGHLALADRAGRRSAGRGVAAGEPAALRQLAALHAEVRPGPDAAERDQALLDTAGRHPLGQGRRQSTAARPTPPTPRPSARPGSTWRPAARPRRGRRSRPGRRRWPWRGGGASTTGRRSAAAAE